jgi:hypothetical protein
MTLEEKKDVTTRLVVAFFSSAKSYAPGRWLVVSVNRVVGDFPRKEDAYALAKEVAEVNAVFCVGEPVSTRVMVMAPTDGLLHWVAIRKSCYLVVIDPDASPIIPDMTMVDPNSTLKDTLAAIDAHEWNFSI